VYDVRRAFVGVRAAERLLAVEREVLRAAQASVDLMGELHRAGNVTDPELTSEELGLARAKLAVARAEAGLVDAREPLNELLGLWGDAVNWTVDGALPEDPTAGLDLEHVESRAIQSSLMLAGVRSDASAEARRLGLVGWEAILDPGEVGLVAKREVDGGDWGLGPALGFNLPLFDSGGARRAAVTAALEASLADHVAGAVRVRSAARRLRERSAALADQVRFIRAEELPKSKRLVRETLRNYIGAFGVFVARQQEIESMQNYVETLREAWTARIDLEELLAGSYRESRVETEASDLRAASSSQGMKGKH
jgi:cobalt-zinc-cadmium efflux system outer membrane protein